MLQLIKETNHVYIVHIIYATILPMHMQLRVYTAENVTHELEIAKTEYLESSIKVAGRRKIIIPKLLYWHMRDFADDMESLLEWVHSQLPKHGSLKRVIKELLSSDLKMPLLKAVEIEAYDAEFCYLLPT